MPEIRGNFGSLPEAERYFRDKVNLPTRRWDELMRGQHARAFVVAGATRDALLTDLREAVDKAISEGETLEDFRARFRQIVERNGWHGWTGEDRPGGEAWRTAVIYHTNLRTSYMAGRWETLKRFPYLKYKHNTKRNPREAHKAWDGKIIATDDPWWQTHYPPNGWGCRCTVIGVSQAKLRAEGKTPDQAPPIIDGDPPPEWAYHVGHASSGRQLAESEMDAWRTLKSDAWQPLNGGSPASFGRPASVPIDPLPVPLAKVRRASPEQLQQQLQAVLGGEQRVFSLPVGEGFSYNVVANAQTLASHVDPARARVVPLLPHVLSEPFEVWQSFERHQGTGKVVLRTRYVRAFDMGEKPGVVVVVEAVRGQLQSWTMIPVRQGYLERQRYGALLYGREETAGVRGPQGAITGP